MANWTAAISKGFNNYQPAAVAAFSVPQIEQDLHRWNVTTDVDGVKSISLEAGRNGAVTPTSDRTSKGYELELSWNPNENWTFGFNAARQEATTSNVAGAFGTFMETRVIPLINGPAGTLIDGDPFPVAGTKPTGNDTNGDSLPYAPSFSFTNPALGVTGHIKTLREELEQQVLSRYYAVKAQEGKNVDELRKYRANFQARYSFTRGFLKGTAIGTTLRWEDKIALGYPLKALDQNGNVVPNSSYNPTLHKVVYNTDSPYYGPSNFTGDIFISHKRKLGKNLNWTVQLNIKDALAPDELIPVSVQPDGQVAAYRVTEGTSWLLTNTVSF